MEQKLVLSSQIARVKNASNTPSDFTTVFDRPIVLGGNQRYVIVLDKVNTMTYCWHNVSPDYQNNIISYYNGTEYKIIEFSNGYYDYTELSDYIKETLITNGDLEPDQASPKTIEFDLTSFKCFVSIIKPFSLDLRGSNFGALLGFEPTVIRQTQYGTDIPNITNSLDTLYIHCDLVDNSIVDGEYGDVINLPRQISVMAFLSPPTKYFESHIFHFGRVSNKSKVLFISIICEIFFTL